MFDILSTRLEGIGKKIRGKGSLTAADADEGMKEIRSALLESEVHVSVARSVMEYRRQLATALN